MRAIAVSALGTAHHFRVRPTALGRERAVRALHVNIGPMNRPVHSGRFRCVDFLFFFFFFFYDDRNVFISPLLHRPGRFLCRANAGTSEDIGDIDRD